MQFSKSTFLRLYCSSYKSMMAKIVATFICLYFIIICRIDVRAPAAKPKVVIAHAAMNFRVAPLWVAQDQGFFSKYGIDSEVIYMRGGPTLLSGMLSGDIQVGRTASGIIAPVAEGADFGFAIVFAVRPSGFQKLLVENFSRRNSSHCIVNSRWNFIN